MVVKKPLQEGFYEAENCFGKADTVRARRNDSLQTRNRHPEAKNVTIRNDWPEKKRWTAQFKTKRCRVSSNSVICKDGYYLSVTGHPNCENRVPVLFLPFSHQLLYPNPNSIITSIYCFHRCNSGCFIRTKIGGDTIQNSIHYIFFCFFSREQPLKRNTKFIRYFLQPSSCWDDLTSSTRLTVSKVVSICSANWRWLKPCSFLMVLTRSPMCCSS